MAENQQRNSMVSALEQVALLNKNSIEVLNKLTDVVSSQSSSVQINFIDEKGIQNTYTLPTVGYLKQQIDIANNSLNRMAQFGDKSAYMVDGNATKKVYQMDLNREPNQVGDVTKVSQFSPVNNWFFESLMNPLISVDIDLSSLIDDDVNKVLSRRYIVQFVKNYDGSLTQAGQTSFDDFNSKFMNRNNINISEFEDWFNNATNTGVVGNNNPNYQSYDEQIFNLDYNELNDYGLFSVMKQELDSINNKLYYHLNSLTYFDLSGTTKTLKTGDELILNRKNSTTRYSIVEVNTKASNYRVILERVEGYDPVPTGTNTLKFYSGVKLSKIISVTVGFNEYNIVFLKAINGSNNIISTLWSRGVSYYTNDLKLVSDSTVNLSKYYLDVVYDYGNVLKDLVKKQIPSNVGLVPFAPSLVTDNFKVVQINQHITETEDTNKVRDLHSQKTQVKSQIDQLNEAIGLKNKEIQRTQYKTVAEKSKAENELNKLNSQLDNASKLLNSITKQITSSNIDTTIEPMFRLRGFWDIPAPQVVEGYRDQEVVQFEIQYRYSSKSGKENTTQGYSLVSSTGTTQQTGYFSNWVKLMSDVRKRYYDEATQEWKWKIEDVSDADTPNINQLDIPIQKGEKVDVRVKSVSEVGWPDALLESEWSTILTQEFPDELNSVLNSNDFILKAAADDSLKLELEGTLDAKGYTKHISDSFIVNQQYFAHTDKTIQTSFSDANGNSLSLYDYLITLTNKINALEEIVSKSKGEMQVLVFRNTEEFRVDNGANLSFTVECEDYGKLSGSTPREFLNSVYIVGDFYIRIDNIATKSQLGLLSDRLFVNTGATSVNKAVSNTFYLTDNLVAVVDKGNICRTQFDNQFIWFSDTDASVNLYNKNGVPLCSGSVGTPAALSGTTNIGLDIPSVYENDSPMSIIDGLNWNGYSASHFLTTIHPVIDNVNDLVETGTEKTKYIDAQSSLIIPINIYFKFDGSSGATINLSSSTMATISVTKKLKLFIETNSSSRPFEFVLSFTLNRKRAFAVQPTVSIPVRRLGGVGGSITN